MTEQRFHATRDEYERLIESVVWNDLVREVDVWLQEMRNRLEVMDDISEIKRCQGIAEACRHFIRLPGSIIGMLEGGSDIGTEL